MTELHELRCETCKKYSETKYLSFCEGLAFRDNLDSAEREYIKEWIERVGCASHSSAKSEAVLEVVRRLYDAGFKDALVIIECAYAYLENPTVPGHPEKQKLRLQQER